MRYKKSLSIFTHDLRFFYKITQRLRSEGIPFKALDSFEDRHPPNSVLLTTSGDINLHKMDLIERKIYYDDRRGDGSIIDITRGVDNFYLDSGLSIVQVNPEFYNIDEIFIGLCQHLNGIDYAREVMVAVDPGEELIGMAIFVNKTPIYSHEFYSLSEITRFINSIFYLYENSYKKIKLGEGNRLLTNQYLNYFIRDKMLKNPREIEIHLIDEKRTSKKSSFEKNRLSRILASTYSVHEKSAILIGQRGGRIVNIKKHLV